MMGYDMQMRDTRIESDDDTAYFGMNFCGMQGLRQVMLVAGVLDWDCEPGEWPDPPDEDPELETASGRAAWDDLTLAFRGKRSPDPKKVPGYKFGSNDSWWVQPEECLLIADALESLSAEQVREEVAKYNADRLERLPAKAKEKGVPELVELGYLLPTDPAPLETEFLERAREFGEYCRRAAPRGGFEVI